MRDHKNIFGLSFEEKAEKCRDILERYPSLEAFFLENSTILDNANAITFLIVWDELSLINFSLLYVSSIENVIKCFSSQLFLNKSVEFFSNLSEFEKLDADHIGLIFKEPISPEPLRHILKKLSMYHFAFITMEMISETIFDEVVPKIVDDRLLENRVSFIGCTEKYFPDKIKIFTSILLLPAFQKEEILNMLMEILACYDAYEHDIDERVERLFQEIIQQSHENQDDKAMIRFLCEFYSKLFSFYIFGADDHMRWYVLRHKKAIDLLLRSGMKASEFVSLGDDEKRYYVHLVENELSFVNETGIKMILNKESFLSVMLRCDTNVVEKFLWCLSNLSACENNFFACIIHYYLSMLEANDDVFYYALHSLFQNVVYRKEIFFSIFEKIFNLNKQYFYNNDHLLYFLINPIFLDDNLFLLVKDFLNTFLEIPVKKFEWLDQQLLALKSFSHRSIQDGKMFLLEAIASLKPLVCAPTQAFFHPLPSSDSSEADETRSSITP